MPTELTPEQRELFAYTLYSNVATNVSSGLEMLGDLEGSLKRCETDLMTPPGSTATPGTVAAPWRQWAELRQSTYKLAGGFLKALTDAGFEIKAPKAAAVEKALDAIMTIPAHKAYELDRIKA